MNKILVLKYNIIDAAMHSLIVNGFTMNTVTIER